jgi:hypothetical protein
MFPCLSFQANLYEKEHGAKFAKQKKKAPMFNILSFFLFLKEKTIKPIILLIRRSENIHKQENYQSRNGRREKINASV